MNKLNLQPDSSQLEGRVEDLRAALRRLDPQRVAGRAGCSYLQYPAGGGHFRLELWTQPVQVSFPDLIARPAEGDNLPPLPLAVQALLAYYLLTATGASPAGRWVSFGELQDGKFYQQAFQGYTGGVLWQNFGEDRSRFEQAAQSQGGQPIGLGNAAYAFPALPRIVIGVVYWAGDEDFPGSYKLLFDARVNEYLPSDVLAILGSTLTRKLVKAGDMG